MFSLSDRKILDRFLRTTKISFLATALAWRNCQLGWRNCPLHRFIIHSSAVSLSTFRMLTRWYRIGPSSCSLNNMPRVPKLRLPFLRRHFVGFPDHLRRCPNFPWFRTCGDFLVCTYDSLCLFPIYLHTLRNSYSVPSGGDASRFDDLGLLD